MTDHTIEVAARAICQAQGLDADCHEGGNDMRPRWNVRRGQAQAVLDAVGHAALVEALAVDALPIMERQLESLVRTAPDIVGGKAHTAAVARLNRMRAALRQAEVDQ